MFRRPPTAVAVGVTVIVGLAVGHGALWDVWIDQRRGLPHAVPGECQRIQRSGFPYVSVARGWWTCSCPPATSSSCDRFVSDLASRTVVPGYVESARRRATANAPDEWATSVANIPNVWTYSSDDEYESIFYFVGDEEVLLYAEGVPTSIY